MKLPMTLLALALAGPALAADVADRTLVEVNGTPVTETQFLVFRAQQGSSGQDSPQAQAALLSELVNTVMMAKAAEAEGLDKRREIIAALDLARYRLLAQAAVQNYLNEHPVSDAEIQQAYDKKYAKGQLREYKARHILLKTEADAQQIIKDLQGGADFATLAKEKSTGPSGSVGGDLGWFSPAQMVKPFAEALAGMKKGEYSKTPVQTQFGWHVILLEDERSTKAPTLDEVKDELTKNLRRERARQYVAQVQKQTEIKLQPPEPEAAPAKPTK